MIGPPIFVFVVVLAIAAIVCLSLTEGIPTFASWIGHPSDLPPPLRAESIRRIT
jgi:hypothetical protein